MQISDTELEVRPALAPAARAATYKAGSERAAALLLALGPEVSATVLRLLQPTAVEGLARSARALQSAPANAVDDVTRELIVELETFGTSTLTRDLALRELVGSTLGEGALNTVATSRSMVQSIVDAEPDDIALLLRSEQPTTAALVLSQLPSEKAILVMQKLPELLRAPIVRAVFSMNTVAPGLVDDVLAGLADQVGRFMRGGKRRKIDGPSAGLSIVRGLSADEQKMILGELEKEDVKLAEQIRGKLVAFEDIARMGKREIQLFLQLADSKVLALALRGVAPAVIDTLLGCMSQRAAESFREEMDSQGRVRLSQITAAQADLVKIVLGLAEEGKVSLPGQNEKMI